MVRFLALALLFMGASTAAVPFSGDSRAIDGDSLMVGQREVRLFGIDAPEFTQTCTIQKKTWACGSAAASHLSQLIAGRQVSCVPVGTDTYGRTLARCSVGPLELNRAMVALGFAVAYRHYSLDYVSAEDSARVSKRGIWSGTFEMPSDLRHAKSNDLVRVKGGNMGNRADRRIVLRFRSKPQPSGDCRIKGYRSHKGELIYHLPGKPYYTQTVAEEIFCTEAQARAAGYRRSRADQHR